MYHNLTAMMNMSGAFGYGIPDTEFENIEDALKEMVRLKREDSYTVVFMDPLSEADSKKLEEVGGISVMSDYCFTNLPKVCYVLPESNSSEIEDSEWASLILDEDSYVRQLADKICTETGIDQNAGWKLTFIDNVDRDAEESRSLSFNLLFSKDSWAAGKSALEEFRHKWEKEGLKTMIFLYEEECRAEGCFDLHPKGGFFWKQNKIKKENNRMIGQLCEFLDSLTPYLLKL